MRIKVNLRLRKGREMLIADFGDNLEHFSISC